MFQRRSFRGAFLVGAFLLFCALIANGCADGGECTPDHCSGPLNIWIAEDLVPEGGHVELRVNNETLYCSHDRNAQHECYVGHEHYAVKDALGFEVKSTPKHITIRILSGEDALVDSFDETPVYKTGNKNSCSYECHRNSTVVIGDLDIRYE